MRACLLSLITVVGLGVLGCKGKPPSEQTPDPQKVQTPGSDKTAPIDNAWTAGQQKDIVLPDQARSAPIKTTAPLTTEKLKRLSELKFPEWDAEVVRPGPVMTLRYTTKSRPFVMVTVVASACDGAKTCVPMDLAQWRAPANAAVLKFAFNRDMQALKSAVFETGTVDFFGQKMIFEYHLGETTSQDDHENTSAVFGHAYTMFWNDGVNQIHVTAEYRDMAPVSQEALGKIVPRQSFEQIAGAFMDYFTHAWL